MKLVLWVMKGVIDYKVQVFVSVRSKRRYVHFEHGDTDSDVSPLHFLLRFMKDENLGPG
jgi:hypothetical protein